MSVLFITAYSFLQRENAARIMHTENSKIMINLNMVISIKPADLVEITDVVFDDKDCGWSSEDFALITTCNNEQYLIWISENEEIEKVFENGTRKEA